MSTTKPSRLNPKQPPQRKRATISTARYEVVLDAKPWDGLTLDGALSEIRALRSALPELRALGHRVGFVIGHAYARAAGSVLAKLEQIEDSAAERNHRQKSKSKS